MILYILRFPFAIICAIYLSANLLTISWSLPSLLSLLSSIIIVMIVFKSSWQHKKWYDLTSSCKACTFFFHLTQSTQHAARFTLKVRYKDLFLVFFFFSFLWNLEISTSKFSVKAHNISKYISQYFQIQLYNNEICKIASPSSPLPPPLPQLR